MSGDPSSDGLLQGGRPSATALSVAERRAAHQLIDLPPVFEDPLALTILGEEGAARVRGELDRHDRPWDRALRAFVSVRSRFAEDRIGAGYRQGVRQYVVLGAGLDTFGLRNARADLRVFEVDHPSTQAWKRARLRESGLEPPPTLIFAPVDFQRQSLERGLRAAGFRTDVPACVSCLGAIMYLTLEVAFETLGFVGSLPRSSEIVFDFVVPPETMAPRAREAAERLFQTVADLGEPFRSTIAPDDLVRRLLQIGFSEAETLGVEDLNPLYFEGRSDSLRLSGSGRIARARV